MEQEKALNGIRVLDLTGPSGVYCTKLLADLGADVIKVEPPEGDSIRYIGPFYHDDVHPEKSLYFWHFNTSKRSITLNLKTVEGQKIFQKLVKDTDIIVETFSPGYLDSLGIGYKDLTNINPQIILVSVTGFGQTGSYRDYKASDLIGLATSGILYTLGFPEDPPTSLGASQAYHMASANAAIGTLMALLYRDETGEGQWVDIPLQGTNIRMSEMVPFTFWISGKNRKRSGLEFYRARRDIFECKDGRVVCSALGGGGAEKMLEWMESEGMAADLKEEIYAPIIALMMGASPYGKGSQSKINMAEAGKQLRDYPKELDHIEEVWQAFLMTHNMEELFVGAQTRGVRLMPVNNVKNVVEDIGLKERDYFVSVEHPELQDILLYPGPPYRLSETPWNISRRAPLIGEHNNEIYEKDLGFSKEKLAQLKAEKVI